MKEAHTLADNWHCSAGENECFCGKISLSLRIDFSGLVLTS
jgi:hypothetical protein